MRRYIVAAFALLAFAICSAQTTRTLVVTDVNGNTLKVAADEVEGILFEPMPDYLDLTNVLLLGYEENADFAIYHLELGTDEPDSESYPKNIGDMQVVLNICGPKTADLMHPLLPAGYYRPGNGKAEGTFDITMSGVWTRLAEGEEGCVVSVIMDGSVDVRIDDNGEYDIRFELSLPEGSVDFRYCGDLDFPRGLSDYTAFDEDVNIVFTGAQGRFYGSWSFPFAADLSAQFYVGNIVDGEMIDGYILDVDFDEPKPADEMNPTQRVADGVYTPEHRYPVTGYTYLPYRFNKGMRITLWGVEYIVNTRLTYISPTGHRKLGLIVDGSFTVSGNGTNFVFDFVTAEGVSIKGTYNGIPAIRNYCDNDVKEPKRPYSSITEDKTLVWASGTCAVSYNNGYSILDNANTLTFMVTVPEMNRGDYLQFDLFSEEKVVGNGTYTIDKTLDAMHVIPGTIDYGGTPIYSWYGDLDSTDDEGYQTDLACIASGTITISDADGDNKLIVFDLVDDAGNKITGQFVGPIIDISQQSAPSQRINKKP